MKLSLRVAVLAVLLGGCEGEPSRAPTAPPPAPPPPPPFSASFTEESLEVAEGESLTVNIEFSVRELASPATLRISPAFDTASAEDFEISEATVEIPAGQDISGSATVEVAALTDALFGEGEETLSLGFGPGAASANATLGEPVAVTIVESGASPCPGITIRAEPWREEEWRESRNSTMLASTLEIELTGGAADSILELLSPYYDIYEGGNSPRSQGTFGINAWRVRPASDAVHHELEINWPGESWFEEETRLAFRVLGPTCAGERIASCSSEACEILP